MIFCNWYITKDHPTKSAYREQCGRAG